jgi:hypothetical protein
VERANATKLARMTVLGLLIANRAELREYDALVSRRTLEAGLRASVELTDREVAPERFRRITRNLTSIERQLPGLASHLANANREASSWAELFFDAADHRLAYYWRVLRRKHPDGANLGDTPPTLPRPDWLIAVSLADLVDELDDENPEEDDDGSE